jgi:hypothetical protein
MLEHAIKMVKHVMLQAINSAQEDQMQTPAVVRRKQLDIVNHIENINLKTKNQKGFIALTSILIISTVALAVSVSISLLGVGEAKSSLDFKKGQETLKIAEGCIEEALIRIRNDDTYTGGSLNVGDGSCTISVSGTGSDRTVDVTATISGSSLDYIKRIQITTKIIGNSINILTWTEN